MTINKYACLTLTASLLSACGGGGGGGAGSGGSGGGGTTPALPLVQQDPPIVASIDYLTLSETNGTSILSGAILNAGRGVQSTTGTIMHSSQTFTAEGITGTGSLAETSAFDLSGFTYATDVDVTGTSFAVIGVSTAVADVRTSGLAAYSGTFAAQLTDGPSLASTTLDWDADILVDFAGSGDIDMTFSGGGSTLIDTIRVQNATISGNSFSGGTLQTFNDGVRNDVTGQDVELSGGFFGFDPVLASPAELGGALHTQDGDTDISGLFLATSRP